MIQIRKITAEHAADANIKNEPFSLWGRMIPSLCDGKWTYAVVKNDDVTEMCFPDLPYDPSRDEAVFLGAYEGENCVGLAVLRTDMFRYLYLDDLKVDQAYRGRGIGSQLIEACMEEAGRTGKQGVYTVAQDNNLSACLFYLHCGFEIGGFDNRAYRGTVQEHKADIFFYRDVQGDSELTESGSEEVKEASLERMGEFFDARLDGYEEHQLSTITSAEEFYPYTADLLPKAPGSEILDLGCGTGLELGFYFEKAPTAKVTGIDLAPGMLEALQKKFPDKALDLIQGSYFDVPFKEKTFDAVVSVESLHHFTKEEKIPLYAKVAKALKPGGYFILTDYFAPSEEKERTYRAELLRIRERLELPADEFYHYDTPLTVVHEIEGLLSAGFTSVKVLKNWESTYTLKAEGRTLSGKKLK